MKNTLLLLAFIPLCVSSGTHTICYKPQAKIDTSQEKCLATMIYGESRGESMRGQVAVAFTALNRAGKNKLCNTVLKPKQYSIFNGNTALRAAALSSHLQPIQKNTIDKHSWALAVQVAKMVARREIIDPTKGATHYVAYKSLKRIPQWTREFVTVAKIDNHTFFKSNKVTKVS